MTTPVERSLTCQSLVWRWTGGNPEEQERTQEPCGRNARWRLTADTGATIAVCTRHANWWRKHASLRSLIGAEVEPVRVITDG